ncbi:hypothetical protein CR194_05000 [Salipaludibacillus keqinensis]|uniref:Replicative helicase inhibitor G39P N-terminal domain-containing protein n=1 Tax=Salipaludibacillus keqinensis TaxID=2045207 RepID=A0A323TLQ1_9BACI|nr:hypothetical protein [Salipaludibacillus keqinensis]PYZ94884.1 hypothetical protein CR194_05000 [Salipaludibacillus keqinensis]
MTLKETAQLLQEINRFFPGKITLQPETVEAWHRLMKTQSYREVIERLDRHVACSKFPPLVIDLYEQPRPERNKQVLGQIDEWEANASGGPIQS